MAELGLIDPYAVRARVFPGLLLILPAGISGVVAFPSELDGLTVILSLVIGSGGLYLLSQFVRQRGKAKEASLWRTWGGKPTTVWLRFRTAQDHREHEFLREQVTAACPTVTSLQGRTKLKTPEAPT